MTTDITPVWFGNALGTYETTPAQNPGKPETAQDSMIPSPGAANVTHGTKSENDVTHHEETKWHQ